LDLVDFECLRVCLDYDFKTYDLKNTIFKIVVKCLVKLKFRL